MKFRRIICNEEDFTSLKERISEKSNSDAYVNSISNHLIKIATNSKNTPFAVDILIVEDNINFIFKYFKAFHKIDPTLKVVACTKTNATKITINHLVEDIFQIKMVLFDYDLEEFPKDEIFEAKEAEKRYDFIREQLQHEYKFYAVSAFKKKLPYKSLQNKFTSDKVEYFQKSEANLEYLISELYDNAKDYFFPKVNSSYISSEKANRYSHSKKKILFDEGQISRGEEFLIALNKGVSDILKQHPILRQLEKHKDDELTKWKSFFNNNLHQFVLQTDYNNHYKDSPTLSGAIKDRMPVINHIIENDIISLDEIKDLQYVVVGILKFRRRSKTPFSIPN